MKSKQNRLSRDKLKKKQIDVTSKDQENTDEELISDEDMESGGYNSALSHSEGEEDQEPRDEKQNDEDDDEQDEEEEDDDEQDEEADDDNGDSSSDEEEFKKAHEFSLHELARMRTKIPDKKLKAWVYGQKAPAEKKQRIKRANKNRPREVSMSMLKAQMKKRPSSANQQDKVTEVGDPRFRPEVRGHVTNAMRTLVEEKKQKELKRLRNMLRKEEDPEESQKLRTLVNRLSNQLISQQQQRQREEEKKQAIQKSIEALRSGRKPYFQKKSETRKEEGELSRKQIIRKGAKLMKKEQYGVAFLKKKRT